MREDRYGYVAPGQPLPDPTQLAFVTADVVRLQRILETLGDAIKASEKRLNDAQRTGNAEWAEVVLDEECAITEDLIGTAFVVFQTCIAGVVSRVIGLHSHHDTQDPGSPLQTTRGALRRFAGSQCFHA